MNEVKLLEIFNELLERWDSSEDQIIRDRYNNIDEALKNHEVEVDSYKNKFNEALGEFGKVSEHKDFYIFDLEPSQEVLRVQADGKIFINGVETEDEKLIVETLRNVVKRQG